MLKTGGFLGGSLRIFLKSGSSIAELETACGLRISACLYGPPMRNRSWTSLIGACVEHVKHDCRMTSERAWSGLPQAPFITLTNISEDTRKLRRNILYEYASKGLFPR